MALESGLAAALECRRAEAPAPMPRAELIDAIHPSRTRPARCGRQSRASSAVHFAWRAAGDIAPRPRYWISKRARRCRWIQRARTIPARPLAEGSGILSVGYLARVRRCVDRMVRAAVQ